MLLWAVYDRLDNLEPVVWPLHRCYDGQYAPTETLDMPPICALPLSVHRTRAAAYRALALLLYDCTGSA